MANCPSCWQPKPLLSERCPHCNTVVDPLDTAGTTIGLGIFRLLGWVFTILFVLALFG